MSAKKFADYERVVYHPNYDHTEMYPFGYAYTTPRGDIDYLATFLGYLCQGSSDAIFLGDLCQYSIVNEISHFFCVHNSSDNCIDIVIDKGIVLYSVECEADISDEVVYAELKRVHKTVLTVLDNNGYGWSTNARIIVADDEPMRSHVTNRELCKN